MTWWRWLIQFALSIVAGSLLTATHTDALSHGKLNGAYWIDWLHVLVGFWQMVLGCKLQSAILVYGWRLGTKLGRPFAS